MKYDVKKTKTKKALKEYYSLNRSRVGCRKNLGTVSHKCAKTYDRNQSKKEIRAMVDGSNIKAYT